MPILDTIDLAIRFGGVQAARDVSIRIDDWEIVGIIGPNGAGKTTTFNMITGFYTPTAGRVIFKGTDVTSFGVHERTAIGMGRTFQNVGMVKSTTVRENLKSAQHLRAEYATVAGMLGVPKTYRTENELADRADQILELLGLTDLADEQVAGLPYGDLKKIELAVVLATDPDVLLLDEPTSGMGPEDSEALGDQLLELRKNFGLSIAMIEHHVPMVVRVCDYVYCLSFGQMLAEGEPNYVRNHPEVLVAYLGEEPEQDEEADDDAQPPPKPKSKQKAKRTAKAKSKPKAKPKAKVKPKPRPKAKAKTKTSAKAASSRKKA